MTDRISDTLCGYLEKLLIQQDADLARALGERDVAYGIIARKDRDMEAMMEHVNHLTKTIDQFAEQKVKLQSEVAAYKANYKPLNDLIDRLEEEIDDLEHEVMALQDQRDINHRRLDEKDNIIVGLQDDIAGAEHFVKRQETEILALQIQAAESEHRAEEEKRGRLQLVMRL
jgi:chromosome segregation ATPase